MMFIKKTFLQSLLLSDPEVSAKRNGGGWNVMTIAHMVRLCQLKKISAQNKIKCSQIT
jgi:hypothetical protein